MAKEEKLKEQIERYEDDKKEWNKKIRAAKLELRWLKLKRLTQRKGKMKNRDRLKICHNAIGGLRWE